MGKNTSPSPAIIVPVQPDKSLILEVSKTRKLILLLFFSIALFVDICNISAVVTAVPKISEELGIAPNDSVWLISAYQLTFSAFLLLSGRMSDLYNPKHVFNIGFGALGVFSLVQGFIRQKVVLIVFRALAGIAAALTIPSALALIVRLFPDPTSQARALATFGGAGALGNISGQIIGALFVQLTTWHWVFWFVAILVTPIALACVLLIPSPSYLNHEREIKPEIKQTASKLRRLDIIGVSLLTVAFVLLIFSLTSGSTDGWGSGKVIATLVTSVVLIALFFYYETLIPIDQAAIPPNLWFYPNFAPLFAAALLPYLWWTAAFLLLTTYWQTVVGWSPLTTAIHLQVSILPVGIFGVLILGLVIPFTQGKVKLKTTIVSAMVLAIPASVLLALGDTKSRYWAYDFSAFLIGTGGMAILLTNVNIAMFKSTPVELAGTVGSIINSALQLGAALGTAVITTIESNVEKNHGGTTSFKGRAAGFWFLFSVVILEAVAALFFFKGTTDEKENENLAEDSSRSSEKGLSTSV